MFKQRILIAGIGNIFLGDDGFGVAVAGELAKRALPPEVRLLDSGIRGRDLAFMLLDGFDLIIFVDAVQRGEKAGTLYVIEIGDAEINATNVCFDPHKLDPLAVLQHSRSIGAETGRVILVGCEPDAFSEPADGSDSLSKPVRQAVLDAANLVERQVAEFLSATSS